jgi:beta-lactamase superfamily II metal-dependent hydrolase
VIDLLRIRPWARSLFSAALCALGLGLATSPAESRAQGLFARQTPPLTVEILDVGQGDSILIQSPEGKRALIDAGPSRDAAARLLKQKGITRLDLVVVSHHHSDHYGGMEQVIRTYKPRYFLASDSGHATKLYLKLLRTVEEEGITAIEPTSKPRKIELGSVELTVFPKAPEDRREENNNSIGLRLQYGGFSVLLTGDSEEDERRWWIEGHPELVRNCTILKLAHHGSHNGTDARWLKLVNPELAVASLGRGNSYGHPHSETLSLLRRAGIPLLRTDEVGTIRIESDGRGWKVVRPDLARSGKPRQSDVDRIATSADDEDTTRAGSTSGSSRRARRR